MSETELRAALIEARCAINSMKAEAEAAGAGGDEQMLQDACETISNEGLAASMAIDAALAAAPVQPAIPPDSRELELAAPAQAAAPIKTLTEAIAHAEDKAKGNSACAMEHAKLTAWLTELQLLRADRAARGAAQSAECGNCFDGETDRGHTCRQCGGTGVAQALDAERPLMPMCACQERRSAGVMT